MARKDQRIKELKSIAEELKEKEKTLEEDNSMLQDKLKAAKADLA
jgi:chaperonin cofactor prefoldin